MSDGFIPSLPVPGYEVDLQPEDFRALIYSHENSQALRWWKAFLDPDYDPTSGVNATDTHQKWLYIEQSCGQYRAVISDGRFTKKYQAQGEFESTDLTIMTMPDELPISDHDLVVPLGRRSSGLGRPNNANLHTQKEILSRGSDTVDGAGTISVAGSVVTGVGTSFTSFLQVGDIIRAANRSGAVQSVASDTSLTLTVAPAVAWNGNEYSKLVDRLRWWPAAEIDTIFDSTKTYVNGVDYSLSADDRTVQWMTVNAPAIGSRYSIVYRNWPKYVLLGDIGLYNHKVEGVALPQVCTLRLYRPETIQE